MRCERTDAKGMCSVRAGGGWSSFVVSAPLRCLGGLDGWHGGVAACCCRQRVGLRNHGLCKAQRETQKLAALAEDLDAVHCLVKKPRKIRIVAIFCDRPSKWVPNPLP